jgi:hypothetical protein
MENKVGATNRPAELDEAARRRLVKRLCHLRTRSIPTKLLSWLRFTYMFVSW